MGCYLLSCNRVAFTHRWLNVLKRKSRQATNYLKNYYSSHCLTGYLVYNVFSRHSLLYVHCNTQTLKCILSPLKIRDIIQYMIKNGEMNFVIDWAVVNCANIEYWLSMQ